MPIGSHCDAASFVCRVDYPIERLGGFLPGREHTDVIDADKVAAANPRHRASDRPVGLAFASDTVIAVYRRSRTAWGYLSSDAQEPAWPS
jgi:hypothetical protein